MKTAVLPTLAGAIVAAAVLLALRDGKPSPTTPVARTPGPALSAAASGGSALFARMGCGSCHSFAPARAQGGIAPDLTQALRRHDRASLTAAIVRPGRDPVRYGYGGMPQDYEQRMTDAELDRLATWLLATARAADSQ